MWPFTRDKLVVPGPAECLPGRAVMMPVPERHFVNGHALAGPYPEGLEKAVFGLGCFWGAERVFWQAPGVWVAAVGYAGFETGGVIHEKIVLQNDKRIESKIPLAAFAHISNGA